MEKFFIGIDLGGTKIKAILTSYSGDIIETIRTNTGKNLDNVFKVIDKLLSFETKYHGKIAGIGIGCAGLIDNIQGITLESANLPFLKNYPLANTIYKHTGISTFIDNDVKLGAIGELYFGEGRGINDFVFMTLGTGIGAAIIINRQIYRGVSNHSGEIGHFSLQPAGPDCGCGNKGCYESLASGPAIRNYVLHGLFMNRESAILSKTKGDIIKINTQLIARMAIKGDRLCIEALSESARYSGKIISYLINMLNPEKIIIGGGISQIHKLLFPVMVETAQLHSLKISFEKCSIVKAGLGADSVVIGAAKLPFLVDQNISL